MVVINKKVAVSSGKLLRGTPGQTIGPFFRFGLEYEGGPFVVPAASPGSTFLAGNVYDGAGFAIPDALVEIWGANPDGSIPAEQGSRGLPGYGTRDGHRFTGFGRSATDDEGRYFFWTKEPGATKAGHAPFFAVMLFARGLPNKLHTRIYLPDDQAALDADPFLASLTAEERATLIATRAPDGSLTHDLWMQGEKETVFLAY